MSIGSYGDITYGKTATMLITLEKIVGEQTLQRGAAHLLHAVPLQASHAGRLHEHRERSRADRT